MLKKMSKPPKRGGSGVFAFVFILSLIGIVTGVGLLAAAINDQIDPAPLAEAEPTPSSAATQGPQQEEYWIHIVGPKTAVFDVIVNGATIVPQRVLHQSPFHERYLLMPGERIVVQASQGTHSYLECWITKGYARPVGKRGGPINRPGQIECGTIAA